MRNDTNEADEDRRTFVRYTRTHAWPMLQRFPVDDDVHGELLAQMTAWPRATALAAQRAMAEEVRAAAAGMLADPGHRAAIGRLPFRRDDRIVAVGDSITADRLGWFELLSASLGLAGAAPAALTNLGVSGNTTADLLERFDRLEAARPTRVLLMAGTNDARVHGRNGGHRMVTAAETERNLRALLDLITNDLKAAVTVITPPAVDPRRIAGHFADAPLRWHAADVAEVAEVVRRAAPDALDLHTETASHGVEHLLEADGVHPSPAGQQFILARIVDHLVGHRPAGTPRTTMQ